MPVGVNRRPITAGEIRRANLLSREYWGATLSSVPASGYCSQITYYLENMPVLAGKGVGLTIHGAHRSGKTYLAALVIKDVLARGGSAYYISSKDLVAAAQFGQTWSDGMYEVSARVRMLKVDLLVIDDVGDDESAQFKRAFTGIVKDRFERKRPTIISTSSSKKHLNTLYYNAMEIVSERSLFVDIEGETWHAHNVKKLAEHKPGGGAE